MDIDEAKKVIRKIKRGKTYFKALPYHGVEGGTTIVYDKKAHVFKEHYLNRSLYERGEEEYNRERSEAEMLEMLTTQTYTDAKYILGKQQDDYELR